MVYTLWCLVLGDKTTFSVKVDGTQTVDELKEAIKNQALHKFENVDAYELTLYRVEGDQSCTWQERIDEFERLSQNLNEGTKLGDVEQQLSEIFGESPPKGKKYYILVVPPQCKSIDP